MKKLLVLASAAFIINSVILAQIPEDVNKKNQKQERTEIRNGVDNKGIRTHARKHERVHMPAGSSQHGKNVSSLAKSTGSGKGKGEIVSQEARMQGEAKRLMAHQHASPGNNFGKMAMGARGNSLQHRNMRMYRAGVRK